MDLMFKLFAAITIIHQAACQTAFNTSIDIPPITIINVKCNIISGPFKRVPNITICDVASQLTINDEHVKITFDHFSSRLRKEINGFRAANKKILYVPQFDEGTATSMQALSILNSQLREIRQENLKPLVNLVVIDLTANEIEKLDANLFRFNDDLKVIVLSKNKIRFIDSSTFSNLKKLESLQLKPNLCYSKSSKNKLEIPTMIEEIEEVCSNFDSSSEFSSVTFDHLTSPQHEDIQKMVQKMENIEKFLIMQNILFGGILLMMFMMFCYFGCRRSRSGLGNSTNHPKMDSLPYQAKSKYRETIKLDQMNINPKVDHPVAAPNGLVTKTPNEDNLQSSYNDNKPKNDSDRLYQEVNYENTTPNGLTSHDFYSEAVDVIRCKQLSDRVSNVYAEPQLSVKNS
ncbi:uncharacterized protein [Chironomus tepperi]|uniref:uncharacterized protein n=1 Tax=Chironomus tepperi TaxID=113505 RepID=UPI00391F6719